jgi:hypothetical protein
VRVALVAEAAIEHLALVGLAVAIRVGVAADIVDV